MYWFHCLLSHWQCLSLPLPPHHHPWWRTSKGTGLCDPHWSLTLKGQLFLSLSLQSRWRVPRLTSTVSQPCLADQNPTPNPNFNPNPGPSPSVGVKVGWLGVKGVVGGLRKREAGWRGLAARLGPGDLARPGLGGVGVWTAVGAAVAVAAGRLTGPRPPGSVTWGNDQGGDVV